LGACLALFALAFQFAVCFAHVHLDGFASGPRPALFGGERVVVATVAPGPAGSEVPALADDCCSVCALIHLAGSLVTADAAPLPVPSYCAPSQFAHAAEFDFTRRPVARLRARAPPIA
jgi:hypothetical protein